MRVAFINNGTKNRKLFDQLLSGSVITEFPSERALDALQEPHDLIILSGSSRYPIVYHLDLLKGELELIRRASVPLLGICYGAELLAVAYGGKLLDKGHKQTGIYTIAPESRDPLFLGRESFDVYEAHRWVIETLPEEIEVLARSPAGPEVIRHKTRPQYGFQFHPEKMCDQTYGDELFRTLLGRLF
ncbi:MAG TPA: gamma-glutamyl-gamma-aminobutyrate hydrolase family protein [Candidatus Paceibacterota bacterium]|jgi:GMP synthase-like glutamine amidotransferase